MKNEVKTVSCMFCGIINDSSESNVLYEDKHCLVILDINPIRPGHTLVIPKQHVSDINGLSDERYVAIMAVVKQMSHHLQKNLNPVKVGLAVVGLDIDHLHIHLVPMHEYHDLTSKFYLDGTIKRASNDTLEKMKEKLTAAD